MSRPKQKTDKISSKLTGCFPVKGCLQRRHDDDVRRPGGHTAAIIEPPTGVAMNPSDTADARLEHTKQWLQNLSTVVNYDPTMMDSPGGISDVTCHGDGSYVGWNDDSPVSAERTMRECHEHDCCCQRGTGDKMDRDAAQFKGPANNNSILSTTKPRLNESDAKPKLADSSYMSTSTMASNSSRFCSQHRTHRSKKQSKTSAVPEQPVSGNECASSLASSSVSLTTELVTLNLSDGRPLGITIVGHSSGQRGGDCGIFVGCVKRGGAAAADGRIEPGDLILEVNGVDLEGLTNERALTILRGELARGGTVQILVAKYWDMENQVDCEREPIYEPVGSVRSSMAGTRHGSLEWMPRPGPLKVIPEDFSRARMFREASGASASESDHAPAGHWSGSLPPVARNAVVHASQRGQLIIPPASSLPSLMDRPTTMHYVSRSQSASRNEPADVVDQHRAGHHTSQPAADEPFLGADLITWIRGQVAGLANLADARAYANDLLQAGYIYTVNRPQHQMNGGMVASRFQFREDEYYVFGRSWDEADLKRVPAQHSGAYL